MPARLVPSIGNDYLFSVLNDFRINSIVSSIVTGNLDMGFYLAGGLLVVGIIAVFLLDESGYKRVEHVEKVN